jgi:hypothetical protein
MTYFSMRVVWSAQTLGWSVYSKPTCSIQIEMCVTVNSWCGISVLLFWWGHNFVLGTICSTANSEYWVLFVPVPIGHVSGTVTWVWQFSDNWCGRGAPVPWPNSLDIASDYILYGDVFSASFATAMPDTVASTWQTSLPYSARWHSRVDRTPWFWHYFVMYTKMSSLIVESGLQFSEIHKLKQPTETIYFKKHYKVVKLVGKNGGYCY